MNGTVTVETSIYLTCKCGHEDDKPISVTFETGEEVFKLGCSNCRQIHGTLSLNSDEEYVEFLIPENRYEKCRRVNYQGQRI